MDVCSLGRPLMVIAFMVASHPAHACSVSVCEISFSQGGVVPSNGGLWIYATNNDFDPTLRVTVRVGDGSVDPEDEAFPFDLTPVAAWNAHGLFRLEAAWASGQDYEIQADLEGCTGETTRTGVPGDDGPPPAPQVVGSQWICLGPDDCGDSTRALEVEIAEVPADAAMLEVAFGSGPDLEDESLLLVPATRFVIGDEGFGVSNALIPNEGRSAKARFVDAAANPSEWTEPFTFGRCARAACSQGAGEGAWLWPVGVFLALGARRRGARVGDDVPVVTRRLEPVDL